MNLIINYLKFNSSIRTFIFISLQCVASVLLLNTSAAAAEHSFKEQGKGSFRWFGIKVYDAKLLVVPTFTGDYLNDRPMALEITYDIDIDKNDLVDTTLDEITNLKIGDTLKYQINLDNSSNFYHNQKSIGSITDRNFASCFISIWLATDTSAKNLRKKLLGIDAR